MRLSKQHKIYGVVLGLAAAAFAGDRFGLFGGSEAGVAETVAVATSTERTPRVAKPAAATAAPVATESQNNLADRLRAAATAGNVSDVTNVRDAFAADESWAPVKPAEVVAEAPVEQVDDTVDRFLAAHKLSAVMKSSNGGIAVIDGRAIGKGQAVAGFKLVSVTERSATLRRGKYVVQMTLPAIEGSLAAVDR